WPGHKEAAPTPSKSTQLVAPPLREPADAFTPGRMYDSQLDDGPRRRCQLHLVARHPAQKIELAVAGGDSFPNGVRQHDDARADLWRHVHLAATLVEVDFSIP